MPWNTSDRRNRLPAGWETRIVPHVMRTHGHVCHVCHRPGADAVDHIRPGDDHRLENLAPIHQDVPPYCHRAKSAREGVDARTALRQARTRPAESHPLDRKE
jgi:5-methylcytosine-specific restriction enzyme A